jgi:hypothetical protein
MVPVTRETVSDGSCDYPLTTFGAASVRYPAHDAERARDGDRNSPLGPSAGPSQPAVEVANASRLGEGPTHR